MTVVNFSETFITILVYVMLAGTGIGAITLLWMLVRDMIRKEVW